MQNANFTELQDDEKGYILSYSNQTGIAATSEINVIPQPTRLRTNEIYISVYVTWMYFVFMFVLPFGCLSVLNLLIYLDVRKVDDLGPSISMTINKLYPLKMTRGSVLISFLDALRLKNSGYSYHLQIMQK